MNEKPQPKDGGKLSQKAVEYTDKGHEPEFCFACVHWEHTDPGACAMVKGTIAPRGWCRLWHK